MATDPRPSTSPLGERVKQIRESRGYSQADVTARGGLSSGYLAMIETGKRGQRTGRDIVIKIADGLRATPDERDELMALAGYGEPATKRAGPTVTDAINSDTRLRSDQKRVLIGLYATMVRP